MTTNGREIKLFFIIFTVSYLILIHERYQSYPRSNDHRKYSKSSLTMTYNNWPQILSNSYMKRLVTSLWALSPLIGKKVQAALLASINVLSNLLLLLLLPGMIYLYLSYYLLCLLYHPSLPLKELEVKQSELKSLAQGQQLGRRLDKFHNYNKWEAFFNNMNSVTLLSKYINLNNDMRYL